MQMHLRYNKCQSNGEKGVTGCIMYRNVCSVGQGSSEENYFLRPSRALEDKYIVPFFIHGEKVLQLPTYRRAWCPRQFSTNVPPFITVCSNQFGLCLVHAPFIWYVAGRLVHWRAKGALSHAGSWCGPGRALRPKILSMCPLSHHL